MKVTIEYKGNRFEFDASTIHALLEDYLKYVAQDDTRVVYETISELKAKVAAEQLQSLLENV
jgi:hypothetical protein